MLEVKNIIRKDITDSDMAVKFRDAELNEVLNRKTYNAFIAPNDGFYNLNIFNQKDWIATINAKDVEVLKMYCITNNITAKELKKQK